MTSSAKNIRLGGESVVLPETRQTTVVTFSAWIEKVSNCLGSRGHLPKLCLQL